MNSVSDFVFLGLVLTATLGTLFWVGVSNHTPRVADPVATPSSIVPTRGVLPNGAACNPNVMPECTPTQP